VCDTLRTLCSHTDRCLDVPNARFGVALRGQVEERLNFFEVSHILPLPPVSEVDLSSTQTGVPPSRNVDAMRKVLEVLALEDDSDVDEEIVDVPVLEPKNPEKKRKKRKSEAMEVDPEVEREASPSKKSKKDRGDKGHKKEKKEPKTEGMNLDGPV
jgi:nucleolar protein 56